MQINLIKLIKDLLPTFNRSNKFVQIIFVLISEARTPFNEFMAQIPDWKYKAKANASVLSIQHAIKRELDVDAVITELDGKPIDFLVSVTGFVDERRLSALIENSKLAGKSFVFKTGADTFVAEFINHSCELLLVDNKITLHINYGDDYEIYATSEYPVKSEVNINVVAGLLNYTLMIDSEETTSISMSIPSTSEIIKINSISPLHDIYYNYTK